MKNVLVVLLLITGMAIVAFLTFQAHRSAIDSLHQDSDLQQAVSDYNDILLQINQAYQHNLIYALSSDRADMESYFASEDRIYGKLSHIGQLTSASGLALPSDSLRPLVARQFLRMERYRMRASDAATESSMQMLDEALADKKLIEDLIAKDKLSIQEARDEIGGSGLLVPVLIFFLFICGTAGLAYSRGQLNGAQQETRGLEEKLNKNQQLLHDQINQNELFKGMLQVTLDHSEQAILILDPVIAYGDVEDFKIFASNQRSVRLLGIKEGTTFKQALQQPHPHGRELTRVMEWLIETHDRGKPSKRSFLTGTNDSGARIDLTATPYQGRLFVSSFRAMEAMQHAPSAGVPEGIFSISGCQLAELSPQGKVIRTNEDMQRQFPDVQGHYLWDTALYSDKNTKHALRQLFRKMNEGDQKAGTFGDAHFTGIYNNAGVLISILYIFHNDKSAKE